MTTRFVPPVLLAIALAACSDRTMPTSESEGSAAAASSVSVPLAPAASASAHDDEQRLEALARRVARAMREPSFRAYVKSELDRSPFAEHKVQFQRFLRNNSGRALQALARAGADNPAAVLSEADAAVKAELYLPVAAHRRAWTGGGDVLVATAISDHEAPIAYDTAGRRRLLDPRTPPAEPVFALVPVETDFDRLPAAPARATCSAAEACGGTGDPGAGSGGGITPSAAATPGLYLTYAQFSGDFEGWLKGDPEYEIHIMGPAAPGDTANLASFQCVGEHAPAGYTWDMNQQTWSGSELLFSSAQMDAFTAANPGRAFVIFAVEDDDTACGIRTDSDRGNALLKALSQAYANYKAAKDSLVPGVNGIGRILRAARSGSTFLTSLYSFLKSNDDVIGVAVSDSVRGRYSPLTNWTVLDKSLATTGAFKLEMH